MKKKCSFSFIKKPSSRHKISHYPKNCTFFTDIRALVPSGSLLFLIHFPPNKKEFEMRFREMQSLGLIANIWIFLIGVAWNFFLKNFKRRGRPILCLQSSTKHKARLLEIFKGNVNFFGKIWFFWMNTHFNIFANNNWFRHLKKYRISFWRVGIKIQKFEML